MKVNLVVVLSVLSAAAFAGNVCTWTGKGGDGKFSTGANWDTAPVSANGDLLYFPVGSDDAESELAAENDIEGLSVAAIRTDGHNNSVFTLNGKAITLTGAAAAVCPEIPAATVISNYTSLVLNVPLTVDRGGGNADMRFFGQKLTANGKITVTNVPKIYLHGRLGVAYASYIGEAERYPSAALGADFNAPFEAPDTIVYERIGNNCGSQTVTFNAKLTAKEFSSAGNTHDSQPHLTFPGNDIGKVCFTGDSLFLDVAEALGPDTVICDTKNGNGWMWTGTFYLAENTHQTINRLDGNGDYLAGFPNAYNVQCAKAGGAAVLEMRGSADASTCMRVKDKVTLVWNPTGDFKQTFRDRVSDTKGDVFVKGGTFALAGTAAFTDVPMVAVCAGAKLEIASANEEHPAFGSLKHLLLGDGVTCTVAAGANPFSAGTTTAILGTDAKFVVAADVDVKLAGLSANGVRIADGTYVAGDENPWLEGEGRVTVGGGSSSGATYWMSSRDGDWDVAANWSDGVPNQDSTVVILGNGSATVRMSGTSVFPAKLSVRNVNGTTTVRMPEGEHAWSPSELKLLEGGRIEVPTASKIVSDDGAGTISVSGGEICIAGGEMVYTNFHGSFIVDGTSVSTGRVFLANGLFQFSHKSQTDTYRLRLDPYGELYATNGFVETPAMHYPFYQVGGRIVIAGNAELRNGTAKSIEWRFGQGETIFEGDAVLRSKTSGSRFYVTTYTANTEARVVFRGNACITGSTMEDPSVGSSESGSRSVLEFDTAKANGVQLGYRCNVGCDKTTGELIMKRGYVFTGYRGLNVGGNTGNQWNTNSTAQGAHGMLRMHGGALKLTDGGEVAEGAFCGFRLADGGPAHLARDLKGAYAGSAEITGGVISNNACTVIGGGRGIGTYVQTGGAFLHRRSSAQFIVGCAGGTGALTLGGGEMRVSGPAYVGGVLTNQVTSGHLLDQYYNGNYPVDQHDAVGVLTVTGGTFSCTKDFSLGCDGSGTLAVEGSLADITLDGNLVLSNTTETATSSALRFKLDAVGISPIKVSGKVVNTLGTKLVVDVGDTQAKRKNRRLIRCANWEGPAITDVTFVGERAGEASLRTDALGLYVSLPNGSTILLR